MRIVLRVAVIVALFSSLAPANDDKPAAEKSGATLQWRSFNSGLTEAKKSNKKVMVDVYTDWCGWCKRLDRDVYGNEEIIRYLDQRYVAVKLNAETRDTLRYKNTLYQHPQFARTFGVTGYPTILFFDSDGESINSIGGYLPPEKFLAVIRYIGDDYYKAMTWDEYLKKNPLEESSQSKSKK